MSEPKGFSAKEKRDILAANSAVELLGDPLSAENLARTMTPKWAVRIPAAIKKAKAHIREHGMPISFFDSRHVMSPVEVLLAEALWEAYVPFTDEPVPIPPSLIAFTEKVESL